jgi:hypothetical protein
LNVNINKNADVNGMVFNFKAVLALILDEIAQGAVIGAFPLCAEEAAGNLALLPVVQHTFAAIATFVAGSIGTGAMFESSCGNTFHFADGPFIWKIRLFCFS